MSDKLLTFVYAYFDSQEMLKRQQQEWKNYPDWVKHDLEVIVTDDWSEERPAIDVAVKGEGYDFKLFQLTKKVPWNWLACRNLGACKATGKWLFLSDIDHLVPSKTAQRIIQFIKDKKIEESCVYMFKRVNAPDNSNYHPHSNSYLMTRSMFWKIGGHDEDFSGNYGTDGPYRERLVRTIGGTDKLKQLKLAIVRYPREVISDASTTKYVRKGKGRDPHALQRIRDKKAQEGRAHEVTTLSFPWEQLI